MVAITRVTTKNLKGLDANTSIASICSVTFIEPGSAPIFDPTLPEVINAVINGANARSMAIATNDGNQGAAPNPASDGRDCLVKTIPVTKPVTEISGGERTPTL